MANITYVFIGILVVLLIIFMGPHPKQEVKQEPRQQALKIMAKNCNSKIELTFTQYPFWSTYTVTCKDLVK